MDRARRVAFLLLRGLDHFAHDLIAALPHESLEVRAFYVTRPGDIARALAWADDPARDALWFEFCWPPFPDLIARTDFGGRRVIVRVHRIEAYEAPYAAQTPWHKVSDAVVVCEEIAGCLRRIAPAFSETTRLHVIHNGLDLARYIPAAAPDPFRVGWCGSMILRKNPNLALEVLHRLRADDPRYELHLAVKGGERVAMDSFTHLARRMQLVGAVHIDENVAQRDMPAWHARNGVLLSTSVHESFGYAIVEAAAVGCDLAVLDHTTAGEFWPEAVRFGSVDEAVRLIRQARPHRWRSYVAGRFALGRQINAVRDLLGASDRSVADRPREHSAPGVAILPRRAEAGNVAEPGIHFVENGEHASLGLGRRTITVLRHEAVREAATALENGGERATLEFFDAALAHCPQMIDVGAHFGLLSLYAADRAERVVAFEPSPTNRRFLEAHLALNPAIGGRVEVRPFALGANAATMPLYRKGFADSGSSLLRDVERHAVVSGEAEAEVAVRSGLYELIDCGLDARTLLKIDVEGSEYTLLPRIAPLLAEFRPFLHLSFHPMNLVDQGGRDYRTSLLRVQSAITMAEVLFAYDFWYSCVGGTWLTITERDRNAFVDDVLLQKKRIPRVRSAQYGFIEAMGFSRTPLALSERGTSRAA